MSHNPIKILSPIDAILEKASRVSIEDKWFEIRKLPKGVFAIVENGHVQEVCSFLIIGNENALLFDTGMGISNINAVVGQLTNLEIIVVNSHTHFDHIGDDWRFPAIHVFADDYAVEILTKGLTHWDVRYDSSPEFFTKNYPAGFAPETYAIRPVKKENIHLLHEGDLINLGNRQMEILHTPGHSHDSIMLLDRDNRILFTGDTYCEWLFAFFDEDMPNYGHSSLNDYAQTMRRIAGLAPSLDYLYPSHGKPITDPNILIKVSNAFEEVLQGTVEYHLEMIYGRERRVYEFNGFSIWI